MAEERATEAKRIGRLIAELRDSRGWSQEDLARKIDVGTGTVSRWERGLHTGYGKNVTKLAEALGVTPALLRPVEPETETQLDRIEARLRAIEELLAPPPLSPEEEVDELAEEIEREHPAPDRPGAEQRRSEAGAPAKGRTRGGARRAR